MTRRMPHVSSRLSYANVAASAALFLALGGSAYAAIELPANSVGTKQIRAHAVTLKKINPGALKALKGDQGPVGPQGLKGDAGGTGPTGATGVTGMPGTSVFASTIPSGTTVTGAWGMRDIAPQLAGNNNPIEVVSFPVKAPVPLTDATVNTGANTAAGDPDPSCTGTADNPTAPPGEVCVYISTASNASVTGFALSNPGSGVSSAADAYGFTVRLLDAGTVGDTSTLKAFGTWAYTAP
jgi:hypothetical protein